MAIRFARKVLWSVAACLVVGLSAPAQEYPHLLFGNPSQAVKDLDSKDNYLLAKKYFAVSYNASKGIPNWVSWRTTKDDIVGDAKRKRTFDADGELRGLRRVAHKDYNNSGFDRGHLCPHGDRLANLEMSYATFVMTNVIPQAPNVNEKAWNSLEIYARQLVGGKENRRLYTVAGGAGEGGKGRDGFVEKIGPKEDISVPAKCWKVILVVDGDEDPDNDLEKVTKDSRVIAVIMPNENDVGFAWAKYRTSVADVEKITGYSFLDRLPEKTRKALREGVDEVRIPRATVPDRFKKNRPEE